MQLATLFLQFLLTIPCRYVTMNKNKSERGGVCMREFVMVMAT